MNVEPRLKPSFMKYKSRKIALGDTTPTTIVDDVVCTPARILKKSVLTAWADHDQSIITSDGDIKQFADDRLIYDSDVRLWLELNGRLVEMTSNNFIEPHGLTGTLYHNAVTAGAEIFQMEAAMGYYKELEVAYDDEATTTGDLFRVVYASPSEYFIEAIDGDINDVLPAEVGDVIAIDVDGGGAYQYAKVRSDYEDENTTTEFEFTSTCESGNCYRLVVIDEYPSDYIESGEYNNAIVAKDYHAGGKNIYVDALIIRGTVGAQGRLALDSIADINKEVMRTLRIYNRQETL